MKAILLAAGLGTRLRPITNTMPKCLVAINGKPLLEYWLETLVNLGVKEILINLHYFSDQVRQFIGGSPYKDRITLVEENELLGTGGTLLNNIDFWQGHTTWVIHADNYCCSDLQGMLQQHNNRDKHSDATLLLFKTDTPKNCGVVKLNKNKMITEFHEKVEKPPSNIASGALFIFSENVYEKYFEHLSHNKHYEISVDLVPKLIGHMQGWLVDNYYIDIGTTETLNNANRHNPLTEKLKNNMKLP